MSNMLNKHLCKSCTWTVEQPPSRSAGGIKSQLNKTSQSLLVELRKPQLLKRCRQIVSRLVASGQQKKRAVYISLFLIQGLFTSLLFSFCLWIATNGGGDGTELSDMFCLSISSTLEAPKQQRIAKSAVHGSETKAEQQSHVSGSIILLFFYFVFYI